jgi:hypothetical protein
MSQHLFRPQGRRGRAGVDHGAQVLGRCSRVDSALRGGCSQQPRRESRRFRVLGSALRAGRRMLCGHAPSRARTSARSHRPVPIRAADRRENGSGCRASAHRIRCGRPGWRGSLKIQVRSAERPVRICPSTAAHAEPSLPGRRRRRECAVVGRRCGPTRCCAGVVSGDNLAASNAWLRRRRCSARQDGRIVASPTDGGPLTPLTRSSARATDWPVCHDLVDRAVGRTTRGRPCELDRTSRSSAYPSGPAWLRSMLFLQRVRLKKPDRHRTSSGTAQVLAQHLR